MLLAIDVGNTNVVFALCADNVPSPSSAAPNPERWLGRWRLNTDPRRTADDYAASFLWLLERSGFDRGAIHQAIIGSVVPGAVHEIRRFCERWLKVTPLEVTTALDWGLDVLVDAPEELGADRRLNGLAAHELYRSEGQGLIVVDFGTATTFDVVDGQGRYRGGAIAPGVNLSIDALHHAAARLPRVSIARPQRAIGRNTTEAMQSGIYWGYEGLVRGITSRLAADLVAEGEVSSCRLIATGGLAPLFAVQRPGGAAGEGKSHLGARQGLVHQNGGCDVGGGIFDVIAPDLTLDGLRLLAQRNEKEFVRTLP
ncbi:type III pantothenate kinase [Formicincola oecophyllae]|uniref:Type III pantothenate kinase n=1 Tax=Formicincola oecophyllae TaxID=2558361 RepID=A0A4Y6U6I7_9PROT|nr:type III pantothenate kinase [Formicincola oecophyllae]QDH12962.1 type III pantothenate kinase [Formicincola oecophyllae]